MKDPVIASDGINHERAALEEWVAIHGAVSPMTKESDRDGLRTQPHAAQPAPGAVAVSFLRSMSLLLSWSWLCAAHMSASWRTLVMR